MRREERSERANEFGRRKGGRTFPSQPCHTQALKSSPDAAFFSDAVYDTIKQTSDCDQQPDKNVDQDFPDELFCLTTLIIPGK